MCTGFEIAALAMAAVSAVGEIAQGEQQKEIAEHNARVSEMAGQTARQAADYEEAKHRRATARLLSTARSRIAGSGVEIEGSPLLALAETAEEAELDALAIRRSGTVAEAQARSQAAVDRFTGRMYQQAGYLRAGTALLKGAVSVYDNRRGLPGTTQTTTGTQTRNTGSAGGSGPRTNDSGRIIGPV